MRLGNITQTIWKRSVHKQIRSVQGEGIISPSAAEHCGSMGVLPDKVVLHAQASASGNIPSTGAFAAVRALNDLAVHGAKPGALSAQILLSPSNEEEDLRDLTKGLEQVCSITKVQLSCVTVQVNPAAVWPVVFVTAHGQAAEEDIMSAEGGGPGQDIVLCGQVGQEGMLCILEQRYTQLCTRFTPSFLKKAWLMPESLLMLEAIYRARSTATAMLQVGGGGILGGLWELAEASHIGMEVELGSIPVRQETIEICEYYQFNPYHMTSAGAILMTAHDGDELVRALKEIGVTASKLGVSTNKNDRIVKRGREIRYLDKPAQDELMRWWAEIET